MGDTNIIFSKGNESLRPVILVHGDLQNHTALNFIAELMKSKGHSVLSFDLPGHGLSNFSEDTKNLVKTLESIIKKNKISNPIIIAHSFGTALTSMYTRSNPASSLVLISPLISNFKTVNPAMNLNEIKEKYTKYSEATFKEQKLIDYSDKNKPLEEFQKLGLETTDLKGIINNVNLIQSLPLQDDIQNLNIPILLITSEDDHLIPIQYVKQLQQKAKSAKLEIIEGGHNIILTNPQGIIDAINKNYEFLVGQ